MDQIKRQWLIRDELVDKLEAGEELTVAERAMAALILANTRSVLKPPEPDAEVADTPALLAHIAMELSGVYSKLESYATIPGMAHPWWEGVAEACSQIDALQRLIAVPSEFVSAETRLRRNWNLLNGVANRIAEWRNTLIDTPDNSSIPRDLVHEMRAQVDVIRAIVRKNKVGKVDRESD